MSAQLGATTYSAVTWTAGDVITEAKLDAMVANDQAYDSHSAQGLSLNNAKGYSSKLAAGTGVNVAYVDASDILHLGDSALGGVQNDSPYADLNSLYRQALINGGGFDVSNVVAQRTAYTGLSNVWANHKSYYGADRWLMYSSDTTNMSTGPFAGGYIGAYKGNTAGTPKTSLMQILEASSSYPFRGKKLSFGFIPAFTSTSTSDLTVFVLAMKTGGTADTVANAPITNFSANGTRALFDTTNYTVLYEADIAKATVNGSTRVIGTTITVPSDAKNIIFGVVNKDSLTNADNYDGFKIKEVVLCAGDVALPFMPKSFDEEKDACDRYCYVPDTSVAYSVVGKGVGVTSTRVDVLVDLPKTMRGVPTLTATAGDWQVADGANAPIDVTAIALETSWSTANVAKITCTVGGGGITANRPFYLICDNNAGRKLILEKEL